MESFENTSKARPKQFLHSFQPIYYFSRCIGLWPFTIIYKANGSIDGRVFLFDSLWFLISICLYLAALYYTYQDIENLLQKGFYLTRAIFQISQIPIFLFGAVGIVLDMLNRNRFIAILKNFSDFDTEVSLK